MVELIHRPGDDEYWVRPWSRVLFASDLFAAIPFLDKPSESLVDQDGHGKHYLGPTWEAEDGSKVVGTIDARRDASNGSIPWLRLKTRSIGGAGTLNGVTTVVRAATAGGVPRAAACNELERGRITRVDYTADYYFYVKR